MCCIIPVGPTLVVILYCIACQIKWIITLQAKFGSRTRVWHPCSTLTPVFSFRFNPMITTVLSIYPCLCLTRAPRSVFCQCVSSSFPWSFAIPWKCFSWTTTSWSAFPNQCAASTASLSFTSPSESCCLSYPFMGHADSQSMQAIVIRLWSYCCCHATSPSLPTWTLPPHKIAKAVIRLGSGGTRL